MYRCFAFIAAAFLSCLIPCAAAQTLVAIGGGLQPDNESIYGRIVELAGENPTICIFGTASADPQGSAESYLEDFTTYGAEAVIVDITTDNAATNTIDEGIIETIRGCNGYFFAGGDQRRITEALLESDEDTLAMAALREGFGAGKVVAGTSAGLAAMSTPMISGGASIDTLLEGPDTVTLEPGLSFVTGIILDQHSLERGRFGRLVGALAMTDIPLGVGVGENTAVVIPPSGAWEVLGEGYALVIEMPQEANQDTLENIKLSLIANGDTFNPETGEFTIDEGRSSDEVGDYYDPGTVFAVDIFGPDVLPGVLERLLDGPETTASGLGFVGSGDESFTSSGVRLTFSETPETQGYWGRVPGKRYSFVRVGMRVEPVVVTVSPGSE
jgi:cyanophycinase